MEPVAGVPRCWSTSGTPTVATTPCPRLLTDAEAGANLPFQGLAFSLWKHNGEVTCCLAAGDAGDSETARVWAWDAAEKPSTDPLEPIRRCDAPSVGAVQDVAFYRDPNTNRLTLLTCTSRSLRAWDLEIDEATGVTQLERDLTSNSLSDRLPGGRVTCSACGSLPTQVNRATASSCSAASGACCSRSTSERTDSSEELTSGS